MPYFDSDREFPPRRERLTMNRFQYLDNPTEDQKKVHQYIDAEIRRAVFSYDPEDIENFKEKDHETIMLFFTMIEKHRSGLGLGYIPRFRDFEDARRVIEKWRQARKFRIQRIVPKTHATRSQQNRRRRQPSRQQAGAPGKVGRNKQGNRAGN